MPLQPSLLSSFTRREIAFIDTSVTGWQTLLEGLPATAEALLLDASRNGLEQMAEWAEGRSGYDAIHLLSHGAQGTVQAGNTWLNSANLTEHRAALQRIGGALKDDGDLLLYGCRTGEDDKGQAFIDQMATITGADVAASADDTGALARGGNWALERSSGVIEATALGTQMDGYEGVLAASFSGGTTGPVLAPGNLPKMVIGDFNNDGRDDILYQVGAAGTAWHFAAGNANGTFTEVTQAASPFSNITLIDAATNGTNYYAADFDGDGDTDVLGVSNTTGPAYLYRNNNGVFSRENTSGFGGTQYGVRLVVGDFNGDGAADILYQPGAVDTGNSWRYALNNGNGTFTDIPQIDSPFAAFTLASYNTFNYRVIDFDGDGDLDILYTLNGSTGALYLNTNGVFSQASTVDFPAPTYGARSLWGDFDGDSDADAFWQIGTNGTEWNYGTNNGNGTFTIVPRAASPFAGLAMVDFGTTNFRIGDFDGDGDTDVVGSAPGVAASVFYQSGSPPKLVSSSPADDSSTTAPTANITLTFGESVSKGSGNIYIVRTSDNAIIQTIAVGSASVTGSGTTWTIDPPADLTGGVAYAVRVDSKTFVNSAGKVYSGIHDNTTLNFTTSSNAAPVISNLHGDSITFTEGAAPAFIDAAGNAVVTDADSAHFSGGNVTVSITGGAVTAEDSLLINHQGNSTGQIGATGGNATYGGVAIGTYTGGTLGTALVITLNSAATPTAVTALVRNLAYLNTNNADIGTATRTVQVTVNDGNGGVSTASSVQIAITPVNNAPSLTTTAGNPSFNEGGGWAALFTSTAVSTVESGQTIKTLQLTVGNLTDASHEQLRIDGSAVALTQGTSVTTATNGMSVSVGLVGTTATVTITKAAGISSATAQSLVNGLAYKNDSSAMTAANRIVTLTQMQDSGGTANGGTDSSALSVSSTVSVTPSPPSVTGVQATTSNGSYGVGQTITLTVSFSKPVTVDTTGGTPTLALNSGGTASYTSGSGTSQLSFSYLVGPGQSSPDLDYGSTTALALNSATIKNSGLDATLTLATPGTAGSLGANKNIVIDTTPPAAPSAPDLQASSDSGTSSTDNVTNASTLTFTGTAEAGSTVTLYDGATALGLATSNGAGNWSLPVARPADGIHSITAQASDAAGNVSVTSSALSVTIDTAAPTQSGVAASNRTQTTATISSTSNETGRVYYVVTTDSTAPSAAQVLAGQQNTGSVAPWSGSAAQTSANAAQPFGLSSLTAATQYHAYFVSVDEAGNTSAVSSLAFTTLSNGPAVTDGHISITSSGSGAAGAYKVGDTVTAQWNNSASGDNNSGVTGVTMDFSALGGGTAVAAVETAPGSGVWTASYTITAGNIDGSNKNISVTATDSNGPTTTADTSHLSVDNQPLVVTAGYIGLSGATGTGGAFKAGDTATVTWNNTASGDNNSDMVNSATVDFSQFGGGSTVAAINIGGTWTAIYNIASGSIDATGKNVALTATDDAGNTTTTAGAHNATLDSQPPTVTTGHIVLSGGTGPGGAFKVGDTVTLSWSNAASGDNNSDTMAGVLVDFSAFGGGSAITASGSGDIWTAAHIITTGAINNANATASVQVTDNAGNASTQTSASAGVNTILPTATLGTIALSNDTGPSSSDFITRVAVQTVSATLSMALAGGEQLWGSVDNGATWTDITAKVSGTALAWDGITLAGNSSLAFQVVNAGGNAGAKATQGYTLDTNAPVLSLGSLALSADTGASNSDFITSAAAQTISATLGAALAAGESLYATLDGSTWIDITSMVSGTSVNWTGVTLPVSGTLHMRLQDAAGNTSVSLPTGGQAFSVDTSAPAFQSAATNAAGSKVILSYDGPLSAVTAAASTFVVTAAGHAVTVSSVQANGSTVELTLASSVGPGQAVTVAYTDPNALDDANAIQDVAGNDAASLAPAVTVTNNVQAPPPPPPPGDGDGVDAADEDSVPGIPSGSGGTVVAGDGNGDGIKDSQQAEVTSLNFRQTDRVSTSTDAPPTPVTLVTNSQDGKVNPNASGAQITSIGQKDAPANLPEGLSAPLGLLSFTAKVDTAGATETFSFYLDGKLDIDGYYKQDASGTWVNLASAAYGGKVVQESGKVRLDFAIQDGGQFDADGKADGIITDPGAPGKLTAAPPPPPPAKADSDGDQFPDALEAAHGLSVGTKDNDVFASTKFYAMQLYRDTLFREAEGAGLAYWQEVLDSGAQSRVQVAQAFLDSPEFQTYAGALARLYFAAFARTPDEAGMTYWTDQMLNQGQSLEKIAQGFANSSEFQNQYGPLDNGGFLDTLYQNVLGRLPDAPGKAYWLGQLAGGTTRGEALAGFAQSSEYQELMREEVSVTLFYVGLLGRTPDQSGYEHWLHVLNNQGDVLGAIDAFVQSREYHDRFLPSDSSMAGLVGLAPAPGPDLLG